MSRAPGTCEISCMTPPSQIIAAPQAQPVDLASLMDFQAARDKHAALDTAILLKMKMDDTAERADDEARLKKHQDREALDVAILLKMKIKLAVE